MRLNKKKTSFRVRKRKEVKLRYGRFVFFQTFFHILKFH